MQEGQINLDDSNPTIEPAWEGQLVPPAGVFGATTDAFPVLSLGKPAWWSDQKVLGQQWVAPAGGQHYGLARFSVSLRPAPRQEVRRLEIVAYLHPGSSGMRPLFFDLFPKTVTEEQTGTRTVGIDPTFKFASLLEVSGLKAETTINIRQALAVITADGIGEGSARWVMEARPANPVTGSQSLYAVIALPAGQAPVRVSLHVNAEVTTRLGSVRGLLPDTARERMSFLLQ